MWPYPWTHVGTPSHPGHMDRVAATMPSQAHAGAAQEAPDIGQWEGQDVPLVRPSSCNVKGGIPSSRRYLPTYLLLLRLRLHKHHHHNHLIHRHHHPPRTSYTTSGPNHPRPSKSNAQHGAPPTVTDTAATTFMGERAAAEARCTSSRHHSKPTPQAHGPPPTRPEQRQGQPAASPPP